MINASNLYQIQKKKKRSYDSLWLWVKETNKRKYVKIKRKKWEGKKKREINSWKEMRDSMNMIREGEREKNKETNKQINKLANIRSEGS